MHKICKGPSKFVTWGSQGLSKSRVNGDLCLTCVLSVWPGMVQGEQVERVTVVMELVHHVLKAETATATEEFAPFIALCYDLIHRSVCVWRGGWGGGAATCCDLAIYV